MGKIKNGKDRDNPLLLDLPHKEGTCVDELGGNIDGFTIEDTLILMSK